MRQCTHQQVNKFRVLNLKNEKGIQCISILPFIRILDKKKHVQHDRKCYALLSHTKHLKQLFMFTATDQQEQNITSHKTSKVKKVYFRPPTPFLH
jgi:hypothetical protein